MMIEFLKYQKIRENSIDIFEFTETGEEQRLAAKYSFFMKLLEKLSDRDVEDVYRVIKRKVEGLL